jgi:L-ascorbate metabolism protein UlaG (beta-lactamase superfamily)
MKAIGCMFRSNSNTKPTENIEVEKVDSLNIMNCNSKIKTRLIWFGHSSFLMQINDENILFDPMFGSIPAPNPLLVTKRFSSKLPIEVEKFPFIDAFLISHDHYDHLDYGSIQKLKDKVGLFYTPLGVSVHLIE